MTLTCSLLVALVVSTAPANSGASANAPSETVTRTESALAKAVKVVPVREMASADKSSSQTWMFDRQERRPAALPVMYATLGAINALDVYSTRKAIGTGAAEANPLMKRAAGRSGTMLAVKALSTAGTIFFTERAWKKNRKGAIVMMAILNGTMAAITAHNLRNAQR